MPTAESIKDKLNRLIADANTTTGGAADTVAKAVEQLRAGYGAAPALTNLSVSKNGTYTPAPGTDGFSQVDVQVTDRYQEGYDAALAEWPERTEADVTTSPDSALGRVRINIPQGRYQAVNTTARVDNIIWPPYWFMFPGSAVTKLYFDTEWFFDDMDVGPVSLETLIQDPSLYSDAEVGGLQMGMHVLFNGLTEDGTVIACIFADLTVLQPGLYTILVGSVTDATVIYSTRDFDFTAQGLPAAKAGWNAAEADFPCTIKNISDQYLHTFSSLVSKVPVRFGN